MSTVAEKTVYGLPTFVLAGEIPNWGLAIKGDSVFWAGKELGTVMAVQWMASGATVRYLASERRP